MGPRPGQLRLMNRGLLLYRVTHLVANLGWVDFELGCSTILPIERPADLGFWHIRICHIRSVS